MKNTQKGFTLVELIITIVIVGILSLISGPIYEYYVEKARFTEAFSVLRAIADANTMYFVERGLWCNDIRELPIQIEGILVYEDGAWRVQNDNFIYTCVGDTSDDTIATVNRAPYHQRYWVSLRTITGRYGDTPQLGDYGLYGEVYSGSKHKSLDERMVEYYKNRFPTDRLR